MDENLMRKIIWEVIDKYLNSQIEKNSLPGELVGKIAVSDIVEFKDVLLVESFFTLYHIDEYGCDASNEELLYLRDCLDGKKDFSIHERDSIIRNHN